MANYTTNYNLKKPLNSERYSVNDQNGNMEIIDSAMKENSDAKLMVAPLFAQGTTNAAGSYVINAGKLYLLPNGHNANVTWENTTKTEVSIASELSELLNEYAENTADISDLKSALNELYIVLNFNIQNTSTYKYELNPVPGNIYKIVNGCNAGLAVWTMDASNQTVQEFSAIPVGTTRNIEITTNAVYLAFYCSGTGTVRVTDETKIIPLISAQTSQNAEDISALQGSVGSIDDIISFANFDKVGFINKDNGLLVTNSDYMSTDFVQLNGVFFTILATVKSVNNVAEYALYNADRELISVVTTDNTSLTVENIEISSQDIGNAAYIRITSAITGGFIPKAYTKNVYKNAILGKTVGRDNVLFAEHDPVTNLIDTQLCTHGYVNGDTDGSVHSSTTFYVTPFVPLKAGRQYYFNSNYIYRGYYAFYNADKVRISGGGSASSDFINPPFTPPAGTAYGRFTITNQANLANAWMCETNQMAEKPPTYADQIQTKFISERPTDYNGEDIGIFTKILCIGDSLTDGFFNESGGSRLIMRKRSYPAKLQELTGVECTNMGYAGYTSAQWYAEYAGADLSGHDACIIQLGVNDALTNVSESDMDAALINIINKVKNENRGIKIFVATIIPANGYMLTSMRTRSQMIRDFVGALSDSDVYLVDLWKYGHTDDFLAYDAGHLSAYGYWQLAKDYKAYISYIVHNNPNDFRYVQFIGTNYSFAGDNSTRQITY